MRRLALGIRLGWEAVLLLAALVVFAVLVGSRDGRLMLTAPSHPVAQQLVIALLLGGALSISVRVGAPNLAVGAVAVTTGGVVGELVDGHGISVTVAIVVALAGAVLVGLLLGLLQAVLRIPSWSLSLVLGLVLTSALGFVQQSEPRLVPGQDPGRWAWLLVVVAVVAAVALGVGLWSGPGSSLLATARLHADGGPGGRASFGGGFTVALAVLASCLLAGGAGVLTVLRNGSTSPASNFGADYLVLALAVLAMSGPGLRSGRGALAGLPLASAIVVGLVTYMNLHNDRSGWAPLLMISLLALLGLVVAVGMDAIAGTPVAATGPEPGEVPGLPANPAAEHAPLIAEPAPAADGEPAPSTVEPAPAADGEPAPSAAEPAPAANGEPAPADGGATGHGAADL